MLRSLLAADTQAQCTGTVVDARWVISAAHCAFRPDGQGIDAMVTVTGIGDLNQPAGEAIAADQLVVHPDWDPQTLAGDALLIHLDGDSTRPAHPVARPGGEYFTEAGVPNAAGWGGRYKLALAAVDSAGNAARPASVAFRMVR